MSDCCRTVETRGVVVSTTLAASNCQFSLAMGSYCRFFTEEPSVLSILPPPLNFLTTLSYPLHYFVLNCCDTADEDGKLYFL
jgi:hypothetical protein